MRKTWQYQVIYFLILCTGLFLLSGCETPDGELVSIAVIGGKHLNLASCDVPELMVSDDSDFLNQNDRIFKVLGVVPDGNPTECYLEEEFKKNFDQAVINRRWDTTQKYAIRFVNNFNSQLADDEEVNTLEAFHVVQNAFEQVSDVVQKNRIIVVDSGLCTTGALSFIENTDYKECLKGTHQITEDEVEAIIADLVSQNEMPQLPNTHIYWYGIGLVGGEQAELDKTSIHNLETLWKAILEETGASVDFISVNKNKEESTEDLPNVSVISIDGYYRLGEAELGFKPNSAEFESGTEETRKEVLSKVIEKANMNGVLLVGTTSRGGVEEEGTGFDLSQKRADAVKNELIKLGASDEKIETMGLGTESHEYNPDEIVNGEYRSESAEAQENRCVYIVPANSIKAKLFREDYEMLMSNG